MLLEERRSCDRVPVIFSRYLRQQYWTVSVPRFDSRADHMQGLTENIRYSQMGWRRSYGVAVAVAVVAVAAVASEMAVLVIAHHYEKTKGHS